MFSPCVTMPPVATGKADRKGADKGQKSLNDFAVEYAKSNRSTCKGCDQKIEKVRSACPPSGFPLAKISDNSGFLNVMVRLLWQQSQQKNLISQAFSANIFPNKVAGTRAGRYIDEGSL